MRAVWAPCALVILALAAGPAAVAGQTTNTSPGGLPTDWRTLSVPEEDINRSEVTTVGSDLGATLGRRSDALTVRHRSETLAVRTERVSTDEARVDLLRSAFGRIEGRITTLERAEHRVVSAFDEGERSPREVLITLARIRANGHAIEERLGRIRATGRDLDTQFVIDDANALRTRSKTTDGAVREAVARVTRAEAAPTRVAIASGGAAAALGAVGEDSYRREALRPDRRAGQATVIPLSRAIDLVATSYPEAYADRRSIELGGDRQAGLYRITIVGGGGGRLTAFVDPRSRSVFKESRIRPTRSLLTRVIANERTTSDGLRLRTGRTFHGGPLLVRTERTEGAEPVDAAVRVGGVPVGRTGAIGRLWTVAPRGPTTVNATFEGTTLTTTVDPVAPPPLNETPS